MDAAGWANVIACIALLVAVISLIWSRIDLARAQRSAREADERAERATRAAEQSAESAAQTAEAQADIASRLPSPAVRWEARHRKGDTFEVRNVGQRPAYGVELSFTREHVMSNLTDEIPEVWEPDIGIGLMAAGTLASGTPRLVIEWADSPGEERRKWTTLLTS